MASLMKSGSRFWIVTRRVVVTVIVGAILGWGVYLFDQTFVRWWWPVGCAVVLAAAAWIPARRLRCNASDPLIRFCVHMAVLSILFFWAGMALNYYGADADSTRREQAVIDRKFRKERQRTRRVRGRYINSGDKYYVYYIDLRLPDGRTKERSVSPSRYSRLRRGATMPVTVRDGLLGLTVMLRD